MDYQEDDRQFGRDLMETAEAFLDAQERAETAAWNAYDSLQELNRIEREYSMNLSHCIRDLIDAIDKARANLRSI